MLEGLDTIDWPSLTHAYGSASDVPDLIRALASPSQATQDEAVHELFGNIWHQHTVYEASAYAVPFLVELLGDTKVQSRHWILILLGSIGRGQSYIEQHRDFLEQHPNVSARLSRDEGQPLEQQVEQERAWVRNAQSAVRAGFTQYMQLLADPDPVIRISAIYPLLLCGEHAAEIEPELWRLADHDPDVRGRACALVGLSHCLEQKPDYARRIEQILETAAEPIAQLGAAMALARIAGPAAPQQVATVLCRAIIEPVPFKPLRDWFPWDEESEPVRYLEMVCPELRRYAAALLVDGLRTAAAEHVGIVLICLLDLYFDPYGRRALSQTALDDEQMQILGALLLVDGLWTGDAPASRMLAGYGLPRIRDDLRTFLNLSGPN